MYIARLKRMFPWQIFLEYYMSQQLRTLCKRRVNINCTVLDVVPNRIQSDALIYSCGVSIDIRQDKYVIVRDKLPCTFHDPPNNGHRITSRITLKCYIITLKNWRRTLA